MRTRKDRGRITLADGTTEWRYGNYQHVRETTLGNGDICPERHIISDEAGLWDVDPATVGEFVGFYYGFKVFEDDIIHLKGKEYDKDFGVVRWHENGYFYIDDSFGEFPKDCVKPVGDFFDSISTDFKGTQITVSGNIHDRPELWKGGAR